MAALAWATVFGTLGFLLGNGVELLLGEIERYERPVALGLLALTVVWIGWRQSTAGAAPAGAPPERRPGAEPPLGVLGALSVGIGGIVGGGIFATIGLAAVEARGAAWLSFLVGGILALLTAYAYVRLTLAFPGPGGTVTFIGRAFGEGLLAAGLNTLLVFSYVMVMALYAIAFANYGRHFSRRAWATRSPPA